ncbi:hypothetical protein ACCO45_000008 [Purpureocillium lilacinum]|uniref:Uncharacterized protein n=1 Tax=Purpureocillium lilacinum TaxID=33203 RepID=A0ACC4EAL5_PURLI
MAGSYRRAENLTRTDSRAFEDGQLDTLTRIAIDLQSRAIPIHALSGGNDEQQSDDPRLDPSKPEFDHYIWAESTLSSLNRSGITLERQGIIFSNLCVSGSGSSLQFQETVVSSLMAPFRLAAKACRGSQSTKRRILCNFDGLLRSGELLLVLGRPGSGCTTLLKTLCGHVNGVTLEPGSKIHYQGISFEKMINNYRGEVAYNQEVDEHFPHLKVGETLSFAAAARAPQQRPKGLARKTYINTVVNVVMSIFGLTHTYNTKVGDNFVRGVSGGERKRVSIAEMFMSRVRIGAWDNSTRGLDAASALQFIRSLRLSADMGRSCHAVAAYQASQSMYDLFDKVILLYEGHEIYYGPPDRAVQYFDEMGWYRDPNKLTAEMERYECENPLGHDGAEQFQENHEKQQARHTRASSPYVLSVPMQIRLCLRRAFQRMRNDLPTTMSTVVVQVALSLIIGSIFFNSLDTSNAFFQKGAVLFFAVLMSALITITEIMALHAQRPIVERQARYAFVHPFTEALASAISDLPIKLLRCSMFSIVLYFMVNLRREPGPFFIFYLFLIATILTMSAIFRSVASATKTLGQAMGIAGILVLCFVVYSGFMVPQSYMHPWFSWIRWINPVFYAFEGLLSNEFHGRQFECADFIPPYGTGNAAICSAVGAVPGQRFISGDAFIGLNYGYSYSHAWRNYGILIAFMVFFHLVYLATTEFRKGHGSKVEAWGFKHGHAPRSSCDNDTEGSETARSAFMPSPVGDGTLNLPRQIDILTWRGVNYDIPVKEGTKRLLDRVDGWVQPGTLTALMGVSGAGKTTLLDVLAQRASLGVVTGDIFVNGRIPRSGFPRRAGYVQQQDLHLETATVREALQFSAVLRQPELTPKVDKYRYVEDVIQMLGMEDFAEAVVGCPGEGLDVEQRKLLSIGVELAAKPSLLMFLDEPTSGLDSQSSWTICAFLRKLADNGQAVLATIHQPSTLLFQTFDRLLFLAEGGRTVYFGDIGPQSCKLLNYFVRNGARPCGTMESPAEYILEMVSGEGTLEWTGSEVEVKEYDKEFALPLLRQFRHVAKRAFQQYFRQPEYIFTKLVSGIVSGLFIGFSFLKADNTQQGFQNALFSIFLLCTIFPTLVNQIMPKFVVQRSLYEVRERPSRVYSWKVFILSQMLVEVPWQILLGICAWASFYFPVFGTAETSQSQSLALLFVIQFYMYAASMAQMVVAAAPEPALGALFATLMFGLTFIFNGVMQPPDALPGFWLFMWRVSPFTYYVGGVASTALHGRRIQSSDAELSVVDPPAGQTCSQYFAEFLISAPGSLYNPNARSGCEYCALSSADQYLAARRIYWSERWRNYECEAAVVDDTSGP